MNFDHLVLAAILSQSEVFSETNPAMILKKKVLIVVKKKLVSSREYLDSELMFCYTKVLTFSNNQEELGTYGEFRPPCFGFNFVSK